ncbi:pyridoxamine 5'-phosphate oxidase family protein [Haloarculaceae archaeon H-GB11]|nr:pyridoxamine 5'-phosphate oxidase family protein [Haloarculaceae archaeon H-GB11]
MTTDPLGVEMDAEELAAFLSSHGHGVLSFGGDVPYGIPVSFGYDPAERRCILQLVFHHDSKKRDYVEESDAASLCAYDWQGPDDWRSVVLSGSLEEIPDDTPEAVDAAGVFAPSRPPYRYPSSRPKPPTSIPDGTSSSSRR